MNKEKMLCNCNWTIGTCTSPSKCTSKFEQPNCPEVIKNELKIRGG